MRPSAFRAPTLPAALALLVAVGAAAQEVPADTVGSGGATKDLPLEPGRTLVRDLTEGSWISVDVSPDGRQVVFDLLGDLYTVPLETAARRRASRRAWPSTPSPASLRTESGSSSPRIGAEVRTSG